MSALVKAELKGADSSSLGLTLLCIRLGGIYLSKFLELVFRAKGGQQGLLGGASRPPLGRPARGCGRVATTFAGTLWISS